jgi:hypothetical protein
MKNDAKIEAKDFKTWKFVKNHRQTERNLKFSHKIIACTGMHFKKKNENISSSTLAWDGNFYTFKIKYDSKCGKQECEVKEKKV